MRPACRSSMAGARPSKRRISAKPYLPWFAVAQMSPVEPVSTATILPFRPSSPVMPLAAVTVSDWSLS